MSDDSVKPQQVDAALRKIKNATNIYELRKFCEERGLEWPDENLPSGFWAERVIAIVAALASVMAGKAS